MKLPFLQHIGIGIHITGDAIGWVRLSRIGNRISIEEAVSRKVEGGDISGALAELVEEVQPGFRYISANISAEDAVSTVLDVPELEDEQERELWLRSACGELVPDGMEADACSFTHHFFGDEESGFKCLIVSAPEQAVRARTELLQAVGLEPMFLTTGLLEGRYSVMFDEELNRSETLYLNVFEDTASMQQLRDGLLENLYPFPGGDRLPADCLEEVESMIAAQSAGKGGHRVPVYLTAGGQYPAADFSSPVMEVRQPVPLSHIRFGEADGLPADFALACGMAVKQLYGGIDTVDFTGEGKRAGHRESILQRDLSVAAAAAGALLLFVWLLLFGMQSWLDHSMETYRSQELQVENRLSQVSSARMRVDGLEEQVSEARTFIGRQTNSARILELTAGAFPEGAWLSGLNIEGDPESKQFAVSLAGFALSDPHVTRLLGSLERNERLEEVRLVFSEQRDPAEGDGMENRIHIYFEIQLQYRDTVL